MADVLPIMSRWLIMMFTHEGEPCGKSFTVRAHTFVGAALIAAKNQDVCLSDKVTIERMKPL